MRQLKNLRACVFIAAALPLAAVAVEVSSSSLTVNLDESNKGAVSRLVTAGGVELGVVRGATPLFVVELVRTDNFTNAVTVRANSAKRFSVERDGKSVSLVYDDLGPALEKVVCSVAGDKSDAKVRWRISVTPRTGWAAVNTTYPCILCTEKIGTTVADDAIVMGSSKGGVFRGGAKFGRQERFPGSLAAQFACLYDYSTLFYVAAEDGRGYSKTLEVYRGGKWNGHGVRFQWTRRGFDDRTAVQDYDIVTAAIDGSSAKPCMWQDAADLYRAWAEKQYWCRVRYEDRADVPSWMRDAPAMVRFGRGMLGNLDFIRAWMKDYWRRHYREMPIVMAYWGWERHGDWVSDYFPVYPSNEAFSALVNDCKAMGGHAFLWPSGTTWVLDYDKQQDGTFKFTDRAAYEAAHGDDYCCINRDGSPFRRSPSWLRGGTSTYLCGGTRFCRDWVNRDIGLPLAGLGVEMIQMDQNVGGSFPGCWSRKHGHEYGEGLWKRNCFHRQLVTLRDTIRTCGSGGVVGFEEPCEIYNDVVGIQDYRDCEACCDEWASVFNYIYHEYLPCFQSNLNIYKIVNLAHCAADGQMPFIRPLRSHLDEKSAEHREYTDFMKRWIDLYHGSARKWLAYGRQIRPPVVYCDEQPHTIPINDKKSYSCSRPCVFSSAWVARDGKKALVFASAAKSEQSVVYVWNGASASLVVKTGEILVVEVD